MAKKIEQDEPILIVSKKDGSKEIVPGEYTATPRPDGLVDIDLMSKGTINPDEVEEVRYFTHDLITQQTTISKDDMNCLPSAS